MQTNMFDKKILLIYTKIRESYEKVLLILFMYTCADKVKYFIFL